MLESIIKASLFTLTLEGRFGLPILFWGKPGTGKSAILKDIAYDLGLGCTTVIASLREPSDFLGLPIPNEDGTMHYAPPRWANDLIKNPRSLLFFDEFSNSPPAVQSALMSVCHDHQVGDLALPKETRILAAANPMGQASAGWELSMPLANRFGHIDWIDPTHVEWSDYIIGHGGLARKADPSHDAKKLEEEVLKAWPAAFSNAAATITSFIMRKPTLLHAMPDDGSPDRSRAWPSHRTWDLAIHALTGAKIHQLDDADCATFVSGFVGRGAASELVAYMNNLDLPDAGELLDTGTGWVHQNKRPDRTVAVFQACAALVIPEDAEKRDARQAALWKLMKPLVKNHVDLITPASRALIKAKLFGSEESKAVLEVAAPIFSAAGLNV